MTTVAFNEYGIISGHLTLLVEKLYNKIENDPKYKDMDFDAIYTMINSSLFMQDHPNMSWELRFEMALIAIDNGDHKKYRPFRKLDLVNDYEFSRNEIENDGKPPRSFEEIKLNRFRLEKLKELTESVTSGKQ